MSWVNVKEKAQGYIQSLIAILSSSIGTGGSTAPTTGQQTAGVAFEITGTPPSPVTAGQTVLDRSSLYGTRLVTITNEEATVTPLSDLIAALRMSLTNPPWSRESIDDVLNTSNLAAGVTRYLIDMVGYDIASISWKTSSTGGSVELQLWETDVLSPSIASDAEYVQVTAFGTQINNQGKYHRAFKFESRWLMVRVEVKTTAVNSILIQSARGY